MIFESKIYTDFKRPNISTNNWIAIITLIILVIIFILSYFAEYKKNELFLIITFICLTNFLFLNIIPFFIIEEHFKNEAGKIEISKNFIKLNNDIFLWQQIEMLELNYDDYKNKFIYQGPGNFSNNLSSGIDNRFNIKLNNQIVFNGFILLDSKQKINELKKILWDAVRQNNIKYEIAKTFINPSNYNEIQELKKICSY
ncbi:MAG: hypothetical protein IPL95_14375 [Saprospiraceae bacterium]|nr:hypothetical protein [Saprospiraceae bacterium]